MSGIDQDRLCNEARLVAQHAYAPYSHFRVGAALLCANKTIVTGCNIENRSFGLTICAERSAICSALSAGYREFTAIAIAGLDIETPLPPCGACRQVLSEFLQPEAPVSFSGTNGEIVTVSLAELLPYDSLHKLGFKND